MKQWTREQIINSKLQSLQTMKNSILKQAFEGKLVPQDPNDEPASELLKRIKLEK
jgi:type I restriction enzyme S subunit